jgi:hypothetical protein
MDDAPLWDPPMVEGECHRLQGRSILDGDGCRCFLDDGGFLPCPRPSPRRERAPMLAGEICRDCGGPNMVRTGTCLTCQDCGSTSGGCT